MVKQKQGALSRKSRFIHHYSGSNPNETQTHLLGRMFDMTYAPANTRPKRGAKFQRDRYGYIKGVHEPGEKKAWNKRVMTYYEGTKYETHVPHVFTDQTAHAMHMHRGIARLENNAPNVKKRIQKSLARRKNIALQGTLNKLEDEKHLHPHISDQIAEFAFGVNRASTKPLGTRYFAPPADDS